MTKKYDTILLYSAVTDDDAVAVYVALKSAPLKGALLKDALRDY
jgi:hypothetical protein